jgi:hypothetical protein
MNRAHNPTPGSAAMTDEQFTAWCDEQDANAADNYGDDQVKAYADYHEAKDVREMHELDEVTPVVSSPGMADPTPADYLRGAALYIDRHGWTTSRYYDMTADPATPFPPACAAGALAMAVYGTRVAYPGAEDQRETPCYRCALDAFIDYLNPSPLYPDDDDEQHPYDEYANEISPFDWNDEQPSAVTVIAALRAAADEYDRTHRGA